jgi:hypothetical protein
MRRRARLRSYAQRRVLAGFRENAALSVRARRAPPSRHLAPSGTACRLRSAAPTRCAHHARAAHQQEPNAVAAALADARAQLELLRRQARARRRRARQRTQPLACG